jgi:hypothetical protein
MKYKRINRKKGRDRKVFRAILYNLMNTIYVAGLLHCSRQDGQKHRPNK